MFLPGVLAERMGLHRDWRVSAMNFSFLLSKSSHSDVRLPASPLRCLVQSNSRSRSKTSHVCPSGRVVLLLWRAKMSAERGQPLKDVCCHPIFSRVLQRDCAAKQTAKVPLACGASWLGAAPKAEFNVSVELIYGETGLVS